MKISAPKFGLTIMVFTSFFFQIVSAWGVNPGILYVTGLGFLLWPKFAQIGATGSCTLLFYKALVPWSVLFFWIYIGSYDIFSNSARYGVLSISIISLFLLIGYNGWQEYFINLLLFCAFVHAFFTLLIFFVPAVDNIVIAVTRLEKMQRSYYSGITNHYSMNAMYIAVGLLAAATKTFYERHKQFKTKVFLFGLSFCFLMALMLTGKRAQLLFALCAIIAQYVSYKRIGIKTLLKVSAYMTAAIGVILYLSTIIPSILKAVQRIQYSIQMGFADDWLNGRGELYQTAVDMFYEKPVLGWGAGSFATITGLPMAHNIYLQMLAEWGVVGLTVLVFAIFPAVFSCIILMRKRQIGDMLLYETSFCTAMIIFFLLYGLTGNPLYDGVITFPVLSTYAMLYSVRRQGKAAWQKGGI